MSNIYNLEPPTKGKVLLKTNVGDVEIELWAKEAPKAVRNFVQLCLEGYYDGTLFHRVIKDYLVQGGDPTNTGQGGESIYGEPFKDEFHSRLRFNHRGLVACANQNEADSNGSQFFITLAATDWLDKKNTIFGRVVGDTVYNLLRMGDVDVDENDRPREPLVLKEAEVLWNPFDDLVPRIDKEEKKLREEDKARQAASKKKGDRKAGKNLALLSFGEEAGEEEEQLAAVASTAVKIRAAHDVLEDKRFARELTEEERREFEETEAAAKRSRTNDAALAKIRGAISAAAAGKKDPSAAAGEGADEDEAGAGAAARDGAVDGFASAMRSRMDARRQQLGKAPTAAAEQPGGSRSAAGPSEAAGGEDDAHGSGRRRGGDGDSGDDGGSDSDRGGGSRGGGKRRSGSRDREGENEREKRRRGEKDEFLAKRRDELEERRAESHRKAHGRLVVTAEDQISDADLLKPWQLSREKYKQQKKKLGDRQKETKERLARFQQAFGSTGAAAGGPGEERRGDAQPSAATKEDAASRDAAAAAAAADADGGGYAGKVRTDIDHKTYMPAAWRVDDYLNDDEDPADSLQQLRNHRLEFKKPQGVVDSMARNESVDDYVVYDPLLEKAKGKFSKSAQNEKKRSNAWAGKSIT